jgi:hypothetical protein
MQQLAMLAQSTGTSYRFARLEALSEWWQWLLLVAVIVALGSFVVWMYRRDSVELPRGLAVLLCTLRLAALVGVLFFFFHLEKRAERKLVKNSRAILLIDTSQSMGLRDTDTSSSGVPAGPSRADLVVAEMAQGELIDKLRVQHDVVAYRFDQQDQPVQIASFAKKLTADEESEQQDSQSAERARGLAQARAIAYVAMGLLVISFIAGGVYLLFGKRVAGGEPGSWVLLVSMVTLIASLVVLAAANLRSPESGLLAVLGVREPASAKDDSKASPGKLLDEKELVTLDPTRFDWAAQLLPRGSESRLGDNLRAIINKERGGPIAGVVLITDGGNNAGTDPALAATAAGDAMIPVLPVGMGSDKRPANLRVADLEAPQRVFPGDKFTLTGYVQALGTNRSSVAVELLSADENGQNETREDDRTVDVGQTGQLTPVKFELTPNAQGIRTFKLRVKPLEGEIDRRDNEKTAKVEVVDRKTRVLLLAGGPTREFIFLRNQLFRDKETTVDVLLQSARPGISQEADEILTEFPKDPDQLFQYDAIVAFDPDWEALDELQVRLLERWVAEKAGGLIVVAGPVFTPQWSSRRRGDERIDTIKSLYPVAFYSQGSATLSLGRFGSEQPWPLQFTPDGESAEFLWLGEDSVESQRTWAQFGGVYGYYAVKDPKPGARIYSRFSDPDTTIDNDLPVYMAGQFYGSGRVFFLASGEMWRVREVSDAYFEQFYTKLIRWAGEGRLLRDSSRGVLLVDKDRALLGDQIAVRAILQDAQFQPLQLEQVQAVIVQPDSTRIPITLKRVKDGAREGLYSEQFTALQEGDLQVQLQHPAAADQLLTREVRVRIPALETERPERNDALLREVADKTGGDYFVGLDAAMNRGTTGRAGIVNLLKPQDQTTMLPGTPDRKFDELLMGWLMGIICGVLSLEWLIRRLSKLA